MRLLLVVAALAAAGVTCDVTALGYRSDSYTQHAITHCAWQWGTGQPWVEYEVWTDADGPYCYIDNSNMPNGVAIVKVRAVLRAGETVTVSPDSAPIYVLKIRSSSGSDWIGEYTWICRDGTCRKL
jgi:hypothetical protein